MWHDIQSTRADSPTKHDRKSWLRKHVLRRRGRDVRNLRFCVERQLGDLTVHGLLWWAPSGVFNHAMLFHRHEQMSSQAWVVELWEGGTCAAAAHRSWILEQCNAGRSVLVLDPTAEGDLAPRPMNAQEIDARCGSLHRLNDDLLFLGDSLAAMRVADLLGLPALIAQLTGSSPARVEISARQRWSGLAALAGEFDHRLVLTADSDPPPSPRQLVQARDYEDRGLRSFIIPGQAAMPPAASVDGAVRPSPSQTPAAGRAGSAPG